MGFMQKGSILRYYTFDSNAVLKKLDWQYSATAMEKDLHERFCGQLIQAIYIDAAEFSEGLHHHCRNHIDMTFGNALSIIAFSHDALVLYIHAEGMFKYEIIGLEKLNLKEHIGKAGDVSDETILWNITDCFADTDYEGKKTASVIVKGTKWYSFNLKGFDRMKAKEAGQNKDLPERIILRTENRVEIHFVGDDMEYFYIDVLTFHDRLRKMPFSLKRFLLSPIGHVRALLERRHYRNEK